MKKLVGTIVVALALQLAVRAQPVKVACIGNSVTFGYGLKNPATESYPAVLQQLLGSKYQVGNFGLSGATLLRKGHRPYYKTREFGLAMNFRPDIAIVHLGLNDTDPRNWPDYRDEFAADYSWLLDTLKKQNPAVKIYVCRLTPIFSGHPRFKSGTRDWYWQIQELIPAIARANQASVIDLNKPLQNRPDLFADNLHPDQEGAAIIARTVYSSLTGDFGGFSLSPVFTDHMVLQRNQPIPVSGTANAGAAVTVELNGQRMATQATAAGQWKVVFPPMKHGGPYQMRVSGAGSVREVKDILIGDVWLCSGQSNMAFQLKAATTGKAELQEMKPNPLLRLLKFEQLAETNAEAWSDGVLDRVNKLNYFKGEWKTADAAAVGAFSAVGYYFGKRITEQEQVPVGLIEVAIGGSGIESWIDRYTSDHDAELVDALANWRQSDFIQPWVRERAGVNLKNAAKTRQRHPYEPCYGFEAGIAKLVGFPISGVLWYQGESSAHNPEAYAHSFPILVNSWRRQWGYDFPFYFVQLSSLNRPSWPYFRDVQRKLAQSVPGTAMAITLDLGDSLDVHPRQKQQVGERLALLALKHTYGRNVSASGPVAVKAEQLNGQILISFKEATRLQTRNGAALAGFELLTDQGRHLVPVQTISGKRQVTLQVPPGQQVRAVQYAWQPYSRANLNNEAGLPASTFSINLQ
ncbi:sialate O-acetylesterase [Pedobacter yulinensis]|uniref:Sialate O-acetylesterase n=1 Tax=Pedobacter yulinensis TaxID=2126353 RepID=A0A2T3HHX7_9SPHI|nr:GDSL-type esterase/lipase family protein [Pedobacter yulinensis]PST82056.1 sialate O-acetylesterase [Pedobacter yulinensis]